MQKRYAGLALALVLVAATAVSVEAAGDTRQILAQLQEDDEWGEVRLRVGDRRPVRVLYLSGDSVRVQEVIGALHERPAMYGLNEIESVRVLGPYRLARTPAPYQGSKSTATALGLELVVPGGGFFYIGKPRQGWSLLAFAAAAVATGALTGEDGAAGWVPLALWVKGASLAQVRDEVAAMEAARAQELSMQSRAAARGSRPLLALRLPF